MGSDDCGSNVEAKSPLLKRETFAPWNTRQSHNCHAYALGGVVALAGDDRSIDHVDMYNDPNSLKYVTFEPFWWIKRPTSVEILRGAQVVEDMGHHACIAKLVWKERSSHLLIDVSLSWEQPGLAELGKRKRCAGDLNCGGSKGSTHHSGVRRRTVPLRRTDTAITSSFTFGDSTNFTVEVHTPVHSLISSMACELYTGAREQEVV